MSKTIKDLEKQRAEFAFECVERDIWNPYVNLKQELQNIDCKDNNLSEELKEKCKRKKQLRKQADEYKSYVKKIPAMIQTNGLGATLAFMYSKKKTYEIIYKQIDEWLKKERKLKDNSDELVKWVIHLDSSKYKHITNEVIALFLWLRRFAEGMIEKEEDGKEKEE